MKKSNVVSISMPDACYKKLAELAFEMNEGNISRTVRDIIEEAYTDYTYRMKEAAECGKA